MVLVLLDMFFMLLITLVSNNDIFVSIVKVSVVAEKIHYVETITGIVIINKVKNAMVVNLDHCNVIKLKVIDLVVSHMRNISKEKEEHDLLDIVVNISVKIKENKEN